MPDSLERKLAVILHADVVDSTRLVQRSELLAHQGIVGAFKAFAETIAEHGGEVHEIRGDALLAEFTRASDAVDSALVFQRERVTAGSDPADDICP